VTRLAALALLALIAAFPAGAQGRRHRPKAGCTPHGSTTIEASAAIRVFSLRNKRTDAVDFYACRYKTRRRFLMGSAGDLGSSGDAIGIVRIAGRFVAWDSQPFDDSERYNPDFAGFPSTVNAVDTRSGSQRSAPATTGNPSASSVTSLVLHPSGALAWIGADGAGSQVHRYDSSGDTVLDSGSDIQPDSLAAGPATLYWMKGTAPAFAPFT
jgi:hypothetical protein